MTGLKKIFLCFLIIGIIGCKKTDDNSINFFSINDDIKLGQQLRDEVINNPDKYGPVLDSNLYPEAYQYLYKIQDKIFSSGKLNYKDRFEWKIHIIHNDTVLNAFVSPGGYHFYYTAMLKYLDAEDQLAGVMGHEMAHADRRHGTDGLTEQYGVQIMLDVALGKDQGKLTEIAQGLFFLSHSRKRESEADEFSVKYLCPTDYQADAVGDFFQKVKDEGNGPKIPHIFSTHPPDEKRIKAAQDLAVEYNCPGDKEYKAEYNAFKKLIP